MTDMAENLEHLIEHLREAADLYRKNEAENEGRDGARASIVAVLDFLSASGVESKRVVALQAVLGALEDADRCDIAASFEAAAIDVLVAKTRRAMSNENARSLAVVGGVAANQHLRERMAEAGEADGFAVVNCFGAFPLKHVYESESAGRLQDFPVFF